MIKLGVNVDHVATLREARGIAIPDPVFAAAQAEINGADLITVHRRLDQRHIHDRDVEILKQTLKTPLNLEMAVNQQLIEKAVDWKPEKVTLVPENRQEITTEGGLDLCGAVEKIKQVTAVLQKSGIEVAAFIDPDKQQIEAAAAIGVEGVELHTGDYAETAVGTEQRAAALRRLENAAEAADRLELEVYAGHGLNYHNVVEVAMIPRVIELNIGHAIIARAVSVGIGEATHQMKKLIVEADRLTCVE